MTLTPPFFVSTPAQLDETSLNWIAATVPSTAGAVLREAGLWSLDAPPRRFDSEDVWYRTRFSIETPQDSFLCLDGLATIAEVWLNGELVLASDNMFLAHEIALDSTSGTIELAICFRALDEHLKARRPRPRWRSPMVENQQLRWVRTTLLGRTPGWSPPAAPVGPWRPIYLEQRNNPGIDNVKLEVKVEGDKGILSINAQLWNLDNATLICERNGQTWQAPLAISNERATGTLTIENVEKWWPHTHGEPALYKAHLQAGNHKFDLGTIGFRTLELKTADGDFALSVNDVPVFCRGACWTPLDVVSLQASSEELEKALLQVREANMNMLRISGVIAPESDAFLDACDRFGILLWHDFSFANLDYPEDVTLLENAKQEARQLLQRLHAHPSLAALCGNSEGEQQAAMWGAEQSLWQPQLFHETLPHLAQEFCPDVPYWPSSAHGGAFPHQANCGTTSYYGVGAYLRPLEDVRRAEVRFATECLAFANVPGAANLKLLPGGHANRPHHPSWKARVPRDLGAGWDFEDVRDHYIKQLFNLDPVTLRSVDHERYLEISRVVTGEVMAGAFREWRRAKSPTRGALVWFLRDLWPGAGWGVVDSQGNPKAAWHYLRRAFEPLAVFLSDEGQSGLALHLINEDAESFNGTITIDFYRDGETPVGNGSRDISLAPRQNKELNAGELLDHFMDTSYAYRFGPPSHDLVVASLRDTSGALCSQAWLFPLGLPSLRRGDLGLQAQAEFIEGKWLLRVQSRAFAQSVFVDIEGFAPSDNYFHLAPGTEREIILRSTITNEQKPAGHLLALNGVTPVRIEVTP